MAGDVLEPMSLNPDQERQEPQAPKEEATRDAGLIDKLLHAAGPAFGKWLNSDACPISARKKRGFTRWAAKLNEDLKTPQSEPSDDKEKAANHLCKKLGFLELLFQSQCADPEVKMLTCKLLDLLGSSGGVELRGDAELLKTPSAQPLVIVPVNAADSLPVIMILNPSKEDSLFLGSALKVIGESIRHDELDSKVRFGRGLYSDCQRLLATPKDICEESIAISVFNRIFEMKKPGVLPGELKGSSPDAYKAWQALIDYQAGIIESNFEMTYKRVALGSDGRHVVKTHDAEISLRPNRYGIADITRPCIMTSGSRPLLVQKGRMILG